MCYSFFSLHLIYSPIINQKQTFIRASSLSFDRFQTALVMSEEQSEPAINYLKPKFQFWNLASSSSGLRIFQTLTELRHLQIGALASLFLIGSVGSQFSPTYAALATSTMASIVSPVLVLAFAFNLHTATLSIDWILWESVYTGSFAFLFLINTITMTYSSFRWNYTSWWLASIVCLLVTISFILDSSLLMKLQWENPRARHSQNDSPASYR